MHADRRADRSTPGSGSEAVARLIRRAIGVPGGVLVATTSPEDGTPRLAAVDDATLEGQRLRLVGWFANAIVDNLERNPRLTVVVSPPGGGPGFQILGRIEGIEDQSVLDGFDSGRQPPGLPQVRRVLQVQTEEVLPLDSLTSP
jgi:hypothetical protein